MLLQSRKLRPNARKARVKLGPADAGRLLTQEQYDDAEYESGYVYEIVDGFLIVSPHPIPWHDVWVQVLQRALGDYSRRFPSRVNYVSTHSDVVIGGRPGPTRPQPDVAAYRAFPSPPPARWDDVCPLVVCEVISERRAHKDSNRNRHLYWLAGGIAEYWIVDPREDWVRPALIVLCRVPGEPNWQEAVIRFGQTFRSTALPRFSLNLKRSSRK